MSACRAVPVAGVMLAVLGAGQAFGAQWIDRGALAGPGSGAALAANARGDVLAVWASSPDAAVLAAVRPAGSDEFGPATRLTPPCANSCLMGSVTAAINPDGAFVAGWMHREGSLLSETARVEAATGAVGGGWTPLATLSGPTSTASVNVVAGIDASGAATIVWATGADGYLTASARPATGTWSAAQRISDTPVAWLWDPAFAVDPAGEATVAWEGRDCRIWTSRRRAGTWQPSAPIVDAPDQCGRAPQIVDDGNGPATLAWRGWDGHGWRVRRADATGTSWTVTDVEPAAGWAIPRTQRASLVPTAAGGRLLAWTSRSGTVRVSRRTASGAWSGSEATPLVDGGFEELVMAALGDGAPLVLARNTSGRLRSTSGGSAWTPSRVVADAGETVTAPVSLPGGRALIVRSGASGLRLAEFTDSDGAPLALAAPALVRVTARKAVPIGADAALTATLSGTVEDGVAEVQERRGRGWRVVRRVGVATSWPGSGEVPIPFRVLRAGSITVRVRIADAVGTALLSRPVTIRGTVPGRRRIPVPTGTLRLAEGGGTAWALSGTASETTVTRLDPETGRAGRAFTAAGAPVDLAGDATALWVLTRPHGDVDAQLTRIETASGARVEETLPGGASSVTADGRGVWVGGNCPPTPRPWIGSCDTAQQAEAVDPVTGHRTGVLARTSGNLSAVALHGGALWGWGSDPADYDDSVLTRFDPATGGVTSGPFLYQGRFGVPLQPVSAAAVWLPAAMGLSQVRPITRRLASPSSGWRISSVTPDGRRAWVLERRGRDRSARRERLMPFSISTGRRAGAPVDLGWTANDEASSVLVAAGAAWVLRPSEDSLVRVPLPR